MNRKSICRQRFILLLWTFLASSLVVRAQSNRLYLTMENFKNSKGATLTLHLDNPNAAITAVEAYLVLPVGRTAISEGVLNRELCKESHALIQGWVDDKFYISIASSSLDTFAADATSLCSWNIDFSSLVFGEYAVEALGLFAVGVDANNQACTYTTENQKLSFSIDDVNTAIDATTGDLGILRIYDLQGKMSSSPVRGNINIINGKKIYVQ